MPQIHQQQQQQQSHAHQPRNPSQTSEPSSGQVRRSFEEPDGPALPAPATATSDETQQLRSIQSQQRQHRASASQGASGDPKVEARLKEIARGAGRTQSLDLSSQLPPSSGSGLSGMSSSSKADPFRSESGTTPVGRHHPSASVDHVGRAFSHLGLQ